MTEPLFTIGHSDHDQRAFISILMDHNIEAVVDVRSNPYSRRNPQFNREAVRYALRHMSIHYLFMGLELGARRAEPDCYVGGRVNYALVARTPSFRTGIQRLLAGLKKFRIALLCAEHDPVRCHRMILVCRELREQNPDIRHIRRDSTIESNEQAERRLLNTVGLKDGFVTPAIIHQAYDIQSSRIAYVEEIDSCGSDTDAQQDRSIELKLL